MFLSHSSKDKDFVRELYRRLTRDGVSCFFDASPWQLGGLSNTRLTRARSATFRKRDLRGSISSKAAV